MTTLPHCRIARNLMPVIRKADTQSPTLPEAPCSVNAHVDIDGLRVQVTGRGATPAEAAANFRGTLAAIQPAPIAPKTREQRMAELLGCWLGKATARQDWGLVERLSKGAALVLAGKVEAGNTAGVYAVRSATNPETWYEVVVGAQKSCTCQDYACHARKGEPAHACKHIAAVALWVRTTD